MPANQHTPKEEVNKSENFDNIKLYKDRVNEIENKANEILKDHNLFTIPIDPVIIANRLKIKVNNALFSDENLSGMISKRKGISNIYVNTNDKPFRKRFTIAHELGHQLLHLGNNDGEFIDKEVDLFRNIDLSFDDKFAAEKKQEIEANRFAAALLMPQELVKKEFAKTKSLTNLAIIFNVSEPAMAYRLNQLKLD